MSACCDHTCAAGKITGRKVREPKRGSDPARALKADKHGRKKCLAGVSLLIAAACLLFSGCTQKEGESSGKTPEILYAIIQGREAGTFFPGRPGA